MSVKSSRELYGWDSFSKITLMVGIFLFLTRYLSILGALLIVYSIWRSKSTNLHGRNNERYIFENVKRNFYYKINNFKQVVKQYLKQIKIKRYKPIEN